MALLDESLLGSGSVCERCAGAKYLGAAAGNGTLVVRSAEIVVKKTHMRVYVNRLLVDNVSACIAENTS